MNRPYKKEAEQIAHAAGLPVATTPFLERMLSLEARVAELVGKYENIELDELVKPRRRETATLSIPETREGLFLK